MVEIKESFGTMSDWIINMRKAGKSDLAERFHTEKFEDHERLKNSGLPVFGDLMVTYEKFKRENEALMDFLFRCYAVVIRAIPRTHNLPRRHKIGLRSFEECEKFLRRVVEESGTKEYDILFTEWEPASYAGNIISRENDLLIELIDEGYHSLLAHGKIIPSVTGHFAHHGLNHYRSMVFNSEDIKQRRLVWRTLQFLTEAVIDSRDLEESLSSQVSVPGFVFRKGYFEFVVAEKDSKIRFIDYKVNPMYLKTGEEKIEPACSLPMHPGD